MKFFQPSLGKVVVKHFASISLIVINSETLEHELDALMKKDKISWTSILLDSCNVMRVSKSGLDTRL